MDILNNIAKIRQGDQEVVTEKESETAETPFMDIPRFPFAEKRKAARMTPYEAFIRKDDFGGETLTQEERYPATKEIITQYSDKLGTVPIVYGGWPLFPHAIVDARRRQLEKTAMLKMLKEQEKQSETWSRLKYPEVYQPYQEKFNKWMTGKLLSWREETLKKGKSLDDDDAMDELTTIQENANLYSKNLNFIAKQFEDYDKWSKQKEKSGIYMTPERKKAIESFIKGLYNIDDFIMDGKMPELFNAMKTQESLQNILQMQVYGKFKQDIDLAMTALPELAKSFGTVLTDEQLNASIATIKRQYVNPERAEKEAQNIIDNNKDWFMDAYGEDFYELAKSAEREAKKKEIAETIMNHYGEQIKSVQVVKPAKETGITFGKGFATSKTFTYVPSEEDPITSAEQHGLIFDPLIKVAQFLGQAKKKRILIGSKTANNKPIPFYEYDKDKKEYIPVAGKDFIPIALEYDDDKNQWLMSGGLKETTVEYEGATPKTIITAKSIPITELVRSSFIASYEGADPNELIKQYFPGTIGETKPEGKPAEVKPTEIKIKKSSIEGAAKQSGMSYSEYLDEYKKMNVGKTVTVIE